MGLLLDTGDIGEIKAYHRAGLIGGVTTNPTILHRAGISDVKRHIITICDVVAPLPVSVELTESAWQKMIGEARWMVEWADNIVIKVPIHGPSKDCAMDYLHVMRQLHELSISVNATAMMSAQQAFLAVTTGAEYVSLFGGRIANMGHDPCAEIALLRHLIDIQKAPAKIIVGSVRETRNVVEWLAAGAHYVTVAPEFLTAMIWHPYSEMTVQQFLDDGRTLDTT